MKLSIITICYNQQDIEETCKSIVNQTFQDFEWIVVDGGSFDGSLDVLEKYKSRINVFISEKDNGRYNAMNKGIKLSKGEWINFMNGGDSFIDNEVLQKVFGKKEDDADVLYGYMCLDENFKGRDEFIYKYPDKVDKEYFLNNCINHQSSFIKKSLFDKYGLYIERYDTFADWEKWVCFATNGRKFQLIPETVARYKNDGITFHLVNEVLQKHLSDKKIVYKEYYNEAELSKMEPYNKIKSYLFGFIPFIKIFKYVFKTEIYLFGIQIIKIEKNCKKTELSMLGLRILKIK